MKILVTGASGQLGYDVVKCGQNLGLDVIGIGSKELDITNEDHVSQYVEAVRPDALIHCAAYTAVDKAEDDRDMCWAVNVDGTRNLAKAANKIQAKFLYMSTDYVFDGQGELPYEEEDPPNPINYYGLTKFEGEQVVQQELDEWFIVRTSWVFGRNGNNFVKTMLRLAESQDELRVVSDQVGSPTYSADLAHLLIHMIQTDKFGMYHATNEGFCSWADFARLIFEKTHHAIPVKRISSDAYPTRAARPKNSRLSKQKLRDQGFEPLPTWQNALERYLNEIN